MKSVRMIGLVLGLLLGASAASAQGQARAEPGPDEAHRLLTAARLATGGPAWEQLHLLHERFKVAAGGLDGTVESWADPAHGRYSSRYVLGPDRGAEGWDGHGSWTADWSGRVHRFDDKAENGTAVWQSFAYLFPERNGFAVHALGRRRDESGRNFEVVRMMPPGGAQVELWLDAETNLPGRIVVKGATDFIVTLADYRDIQGVKLPGTVRASTGLLRYDHVTSLDSAEIDPAAAGDPFAAPAPAPVDYRFAPGETRSTSLLTPNG
ncbi:MAG: hypothetical protein WDN69_32490 [Aliidongia sp.]